MKYAKTKNYEAILSQNIFKSKLGENFGPAFKRLRICLANKISFVSLE